MCFNEGLQLLLAGCRYNAALALFDKAPRCCTKVGCDWWCASSNNYSWRSNSSSSKKLVATTNDAAVGWRHVVGSGWSRRRAAALLASNRGNATKVVTAKTVEVNDDKETGNQHGRKGVGEWARSGLLCTCARLPHFYRTRCFHCHTRRGQKLELLLCGADSNGGGGKTGNGGGGAGRGRGGRKEGRGAVLCWKWW
jgi:hypothetical protein